MIKYNNKWRKLTFSEDGRYRSKFFSVAGLPLSIKLNKQTSFGYENRMKPKNIIVFDYFKIQIDLVWLQ